MTSEFHATATLIELPPEIIYLVLQALREDESTEPKRGLAACSLTCRYWAKVLQPLLFYSLVLRGPNDVARLLEICRGSPHLAEFIQVIHIAQYSLSYTWFHHISKVLSFLSRDVHTTLTIQGPQSIPTESAQHQDRSVTSLSLYGLPRQLPLSHLQFSRLVISGVQLRRREYLARFVRSLPDQHSCAIERVAFLEHYPPDEEPPSPAPRSLPEALDEIEVSHCTDKDIPGQLALASSFILNEDAEFGGNVWSLTVEVLLALHYHLLPHCCRCVRVSLADRNTIYVVAANAFQPGAENHCVIEVFKSEDSHPSSDALAIMLTYSGVHDNPRAIDWDSVQRVLQRFPSLAYFSVGFKDATSFRWLLEAILRRDILSDLADAEQLRVIDMMPPDDSGWYWQHWDQHYIFSAPDHYTRDDTTLTLSPSERVGWLMRPSAATQEECLDEVFATRKCPAGDAGGPDDSASDGGPPVNLKAIDEKRA
ncbi:hypothetical protein PHLGIDRAFT_487886 [Phlebiopsis gigantea 11061_1 CR5-6]|uniref:F-box domain-containing protein n=1 Tax=Phlebiopsis gigantea (strain 11061_1 CR5-6) TaxID=745531 RepID=A0A0C3PI92_PHLG1|nr:hypothetical protein PHLGIDRAFT_487886 [Phlebiopsis gigantea 11061_1 CR5-6]